MGVNFRPSLLKEELRLRMFVNKVLRRTFGSKREEVTGSRANYIVKRFVIKIRHQILFG